MSDTMARMRAGSPHSPETAQTGRLPWLLSPVNALIVLATLVAFGLRVYYQYSRPGFLLGVYEYDDGPYFGSSVLLVHGILPYRDFIFVQPPGITLLMAPVGLLTNLIGTDWGLAIGRLLTMLAGSAGVFLAGWLVRHRGPFAVLVTSGLLAVYPDSVAASHTVLVEPWLVLFCLIGAVAIFEGDRLTTNRRRLAWGGVAFGFAGAIEAWAIVPVLVIAAMYLPQLRKGMVFAAGVAVGFLVPVVPFAAAAPRQFYQSLITAQIGSRAHVHRVSVWNRLYNMTGLPQGHVFGHWTIVATALLMALAVITAYLVLPALTRRWPARLDWFAAVTAGLVGVMFLWPPQFHYHFSAFLGPFLAIALGLSLNRLVDAALARRARPGRTARGKAGPDAGTMNGSGTAAGARGTADLWAGAARPGVTAASSAPDAGPAAEHLSTLRAEPARGAHRGGGHRAVPASGAADWQRRAVAALAGLALILLAAVQAGSESLAPPVIGPIPAAVQRIIPAGSCVVTDQIALAVASDRLVSNIPGCPYVVDGLGADLALSHGLSPGTGAGRVPAVAALWGTAFAHAQYVLLSWASDRRIPWTPTLQAYLKDHFTRVFQYQGRITIYARRQPAGA